ncbi:hypothetical protein [Microvirga flavescens]|nr:hypothetical protein [Microvirga flavescens]
MIRHAKKQVQPLQRPHVQRLAGVVVVLMVVALAVYGYQFWWSE